MPITTNEQESGHGTELRATTSRVRAATLMIATVLWTVVIGLSAGCAAPRAAIMLAGDEAMAVPADLRDDGLKQFLHDHVAVNERVSWFQATSAIYDEIDRESSSPLRGEEGGTPLRGVSLAATDSSIRCVYSGTVVVLQQQDGHWRPAGTFKLDVEHTWPRNAEWGDGVGSGTVAEVDLHHLFPAAAGINRSRGNHRFGTPTVEVRELRVKDTGFLAGEDEGGTASGSRIGRDEAGRSVFEPPAAHRGNAARAMFYVSVRYHKPIPDDMEPTLRQWHMADPVDDAERARTQRIRSRQGNANPFVLEPALVERIDDF